MNEILIKRVNETNITIVQVAATSSCLFTPSPTHLAWTSQANANASWKTRFWLQPWCRRPRLGAMASNATWYAYPLNLSSAGCLPSILTR